jgi:hypothetical protein
VPHRRPGDIRLDGNRAGGDRVDDPAGLIHPDVHCRHPRAFRGEPPGDPFAKPAACARDERDLSTESCHVPLSRD